MTDLSPAAQAILDAVDNVPINVDWWPEGMPDLAAAALRAAADQVVPESCFESDDITAIRQQLLAIADELEAQ